MGSKLFIVIMYSNFDKSRIGYVGLFPSKQEILKRIVLLNYNDLIFKPKKYKTVKSLFACIEIKQNKKHHFNTYHLTDDKKRIIPHQPPV